MADTSRPRNRTTPDSGASSRLKQRRSDDFPEPDGPSRTVMPSPDTARSTPRSTVRPPRFRDTPSISSTGGTTTPA